MARTEVQVQWSSANSLSVAAAGNGTSDEVNLTANTLKARIQLKADNNGTPADGDVVEFYLLETSGDPDGTGSDEFDTAKHGTPLARLNTFAPDGEDPAIAHVQLPLPQKGLKIYADNKAASNAITVSATITEET